MCTNILYPIFAQNKCDVMPPCNFCQLVPHQLKRVTAQRHIDCESKLSQSLLRSADCRCRGSLNNTDVIVPGIKDENDDDDHFSIPATPMMMMMAMPFITIHAVS